MYQARCRRSENAEQASLLELLLAFFAPVYFNHGRFTLKTAMVSTFAGIYIKRNCLAALVTFIAGELLNEAGYSILGALITLGFVVFAGLCGVFLTAMFDKGRDHS